MGWALSRAVGGDRYEEVRFILCMEIAVATILGGYITYLCVIHSIAAAEHCVKECRSKGGDSCALFC